MTSIQALLAALALAAGAAGCTLSEDSLTLESNARLLENEADTNLIVPAYSDDREGMAVVGDLDGDGLDDLVIGNGYYRAEGEAERMERGAVYVAYGAAGRSGDVEIGDAVLELADPFYSNQQVAVAAAGDVDGDGYDDFLATNHHFYSWCTDIAPDPDPTFDPPRRDVTFLVYGGPERLAGTRRIVDVGSAIRGDQDCTGFGGEVAGLGDLDGDGYGDFALRSWRPRTVDEWGGQEADPGLHDGPRLLRLGRPPAGRDRHRGRRRDAARLRRFHRRVRPGRRR